MIHDGDAEVMILLPHLHLISCCQFLRSDDRVWSNVNFWVISINNDGFSEVNEIQSCCVEFRNCLLRIWITMNSCEEKSYCIFTACILM